MDSFVFAVALKKNAVKLQKEYQDLVSLILFLDNVMNYQINLQTQLPDNCDARAFMTWSPCSWI